ncbi:hypothetical protein [Paracoccus actinidiae]|uniref:hypothetical protein n=1 Tax=Paracoccus actinidiae TaxID=3064531 RepID=UPI0027D2BCFA|nr:hypothetical protein [Paracoccus sp. M09]
MTIDNPVADAVYQVLQMLPEVEQALAGVVADAASTASERHLAAALQRQARAKKVFSSTELDDLTQLLSSIIATHGPLTQKIWVNDEHCMSGGWLQTVVVPGQQARQECYVTLLQFHQAIRVVADLNQAHRIACRIMP